MAGDGFLGGGGGNRGGWEGYRGGEKKKKKIERDERRSGTGTSKWVMGRGWLSLGVIYYLGGEMLGGTEGLCTSDGIGSGGGGGTAEKRGCPFLGGPSPWRGLVMAMQGLVIILVRERLWIEGREYGGGWKARAGRIDGGRGFLGGETEG